jgi:hypothetical protein
MKLGTDVNKGKRNILGMGPNLYMPRWLPWQPFLKMAAITWNDHLSFPVEAIYSYNYTGN